MTRRSLAILAVCALLIAALTVTGPGSVASAAPPSGPDYVQDQIIVGFTADASDADRDDALAGAQATSERTLDGIAASLARVPVGTVANAIAALKRHAKVRYAEPNYFVHAIAPTSGPLALSANDPRFAELWGLKNTGQVINGTAGTAGADISAEAAWTTTSGSASVIVGVVDTGVDYNHPDLAANVWSNPGVAGCSGGTHGYNAITGSCDPMDDHYHGTHVSGTIGAVGNNGTGVVGVSWTTSIMGLKFLDSAGSGTTANAIRAIDFAVQAKIAGQNVRVLSNSWGGGGFSQALLDEINKANANNILFVAAAGNSSANNDTSPHYPSSYNAPNIISVAATDNRDGLASFSNYGATTVHVGAPGVDVLSLQPGNLYQYLSGTSMATPHVSGVAALVLSAPGFSGLTVAQLKSQILNNVDPIPSLAGKTTTGGRLNAAKAVGSAPPPPPTPDFALTVSPSSVTVAPGAAATYNVTITPSGGFTGAVTLSTSALPAGAAASFSPNPATSSSTLTVTTSAGTPTGSYPFTITGASGTLTHTANATLVVATAPVPDFSLSASPTSRTINAGRKTNYSITVTPSGGFAGQVTFDVAGVPSGATWSFNPNPSGTSSTLTVRTTTTTAKQTFTLTITGTSGTLIHTTMVSLTVQ